MNDSSSLSCPLVFDDDLLICSAVERERVLNRYPALAGDVALRRLFAHLLGSTRRDDDGGLVLLPSRALRCLRTGRERTRPSYLPILDRFRTEVFDFVLTEGSEGRCRCVASHACPPSLLRSLRSSAFRPDPVSFVTGEPIRSPAPYAGASRPENASALAYLESVPASAHALAVSRARTVASDPDLDDHDLRVLAQLFRDPRSRYTAAERSLRLFPTGGAILLTRKTRKRVLASYGSLDLRQAQLAIVSRLWDLPSLRAKLVDPEWSVWRHLAKATGLGPDAAKPALKTALYSVLFGASKKGIRSRLAGVGFSKPAIRGFFADPLVAELLDRRELALSRLLDGEPVLDAYGTPLSVTPRDPNTRTYEARRNEDAARRALARSALACQVQSFEFRIMDEAVVRYCAETEGLDLVGMIHDGAYFLAESVPVMRRHLDVMADRVARVSLDLLGAELRVESDPGERRGRRPRVATSLESLDRPSLATEAGSSSRPQTAPLTDGADSLQLFAGNRRNTSNYRRAMGTGHRDARGPHGHALGTHAGKIEW